MKLRDFLGIKEDVAAVGCASSVTKRIERVLEKEIEDLSADELAFLIRQNMGGSMILAKAATLLWEEPFVLGGALLHAFLEADPTAIEGIEDFSEDGYGLYGFLTASIDSIQARIQEMQASLYTTKFLSEEPTRS